MSIRIVRNNPVQMQCDAIVSPICADGNQGEEEKLRSCYRNRLKEAERQGVHSVTLPLGYPRDEAMTVALEEIREFRGADEMDIVLVVSDGEASARAKEFAPQLKQYIEQSQVLGIRANECDKLRKREKSVRTPFARLLGKSAESAGANAAMPEEEMCSICAAPMAMESDEEENREEAFRAELEERLSHRQDSFSEYLLYLIGKKGLTNAQVYKASLVDKKVFSKIKNNPDYHPQKITALCLCVGAQLNIDETLDLLARAGYSLSPYYETDVIFRFFIERECYDMIDLDIMLEEMGLPCIVS